MFLCFCMHLLFNMPYSFSRNYSRTWLIVGESSNYSIALEFLSCVIENSKQVCLHDLVQIYDGKKYCFLTQNLKEKDGRRRDKNDSIWIFFQ